MFWSLFICTVCLVSSLGIFIQTERCRRRCYLCPDMFMSKDGRSRSLVALKFLGRAEEARYAIIHDSKVRRLYLIERYAWCVLGVVGGIGAFIFL